MRFSFAIYVLKIGAPPNFGFPLPSDWLLILAVGFSGVYGRILVILDLLAVGIAALRGPVDLVASTPPVMVIHITFFLLVSPVLMS